MKKKILDLSSFYQPTKHSTLVSAERNILPIEVPISRLYLLEQPTLGVLSITEQSPHTHIIGK